MKSIGTDIVNIKRIEKVLNRHGLRFLKCFMTKREVSSLLKKYGCSGHDCSSAGAVIPCDLLDSKLFVSSVAKRWAAKEAVIKAFGGNILFKEFEIVSSTSESTFSSGAPEVLFIEKTTSKCLISISDDYPYAQAFACLL